MKFEVRGLCKNFGDKKVLSDVSFEVESGMALGLLGRNGAGKTTTIRIIMGVFAGDGCVLVDGKEIDRDKINIGYLPEERGLYPKITIIEQLIYFAVLRGMPKKEARISAMKWLAKLDMSSYANSKLDTLSKGNQQKIQLAGALMTNPDIIILDEPFSGLDPVNAMLLKDVVKELIDSGKIVIFSSHQMNYIEEFCENIAILNKGKIALSGNIKDIKRSYDRKKLVLRGSDNIKVEQIIKQQLQEIVSDTSVEQDNLYVTLKSDELKAEFLLKLAEFKLDFDSIAVYEPTLNDIFVEYTEE